MKKVNILCAVIFALSVAACNKTNNIDSAISLTPSTTQATVGETVAVALTSSANASKWTVTPASAKAAYSITTSKVNYYTFNQPGLYTIAVSARSIAYDSTANQNLDSCWAHSNKRSACVKGVDSASTLISVTK